MADLLTTRKLIEILKKQDPAGDRVLVFRIEDEHGGEVIASGDVYPQDICVIKKDAYQTQDGDRDTLCLNIQLDAAE